ncbi:MAG TPA: response regulator [Cyclobacteriaceae bacterium]|jgi:CheY-like chemotaxis protein|nr:response regulator [Cyclobacteriaceae bacterium]
MRIAPLNLLLADDDLDDCKFFQDALEELNISAKLATVHDGVQLMQLLLKMEGALPDALYLDLNMPRKDGFDCLVEIKQNQKLRHLPIIIVSTSFNLEVVNLLHQNGANYYICKPGEFLNIKKMILLSLSLIFEKGKKQPVLEEFVLTPI